MLHLSKVESKHLGCRCIPNSYTRFVFAPNGARTASVLLPELPRSFSLILAHIVITTLQMATVIGKRKVAQVGSAIAEMAFLNAILATLPANDPLHSKITGLFAEDADEDADWNCQCDAVLAEARRKIV
jgi:hypothetical protein